MSRRHRPILAGLLVAAVGYATMFRLFGLFGLAMAAVFVLASGREPNAR